MKKNNHFIKTIKNIFSKRKEVDLSKIDKYYMHIDVIWIVNCIDSVILARAFIWYIGKRLNKSNNRILIINSLRAASLYIDNKISEKDLLIYMDSCKEKIKDYDYIPYIDLIEKNFDAYILILTIDLIDYILYKRYYILNNLRTLFCSDSDYGLFDSFFERLIKFFKQREISVSIYSIFRSINKLSFSEILLLKENNKTKRITISEEIDKEFLSDDERNIMDILG
jgi:hypothetical protein